MDEKKLIIAVEGRNSMVEIAGRGHTVTVGKAVWVVAEQRQ